MNSAFNLLDTLYKTYELPPQSERRKLLIDEMQQTEKRGHGCHSCSGLCCTYENNSMRVDPLQALELLVFVLNNFDEEIWLAIEQNIKDYRLDKHFHSGRDVFIRRYYTCPFYLKKKQGCPISRKAKPYGCLAFNALKEKVSTSGFCSSSQNILKKREDLFEKKEDKANEFLIGALDLYWSKLPMPLALKELRIQIERKLS